MTNVYTNHNNVSEYQISGIPYSVTGVAPASNNNQSIKIEFNSVTRWIVVYNKDNLNGSKPLHFAFSEQGLFNNKKFTLLSGKKTDRLEIKCKELYLCGDLNQNAEYSIVVGLTNINSKSFPTLSGEGI